MKIVHIKVNSEVEYHKDIIKQKFEKWSLSLEPQHHHVYNHQISFLSEKLKNSQPIPSAILIPLVFNQYHELDVLVTVRHNKLSLFAGEVCMPGGKCEKNETHQETALRETKEEIGLKEDNIQILCEGPSLFNYRNEKLYIVYPVYGLIMKSFYAALSKNEVADVFTVSFSKVLECCVDSFGVPGSGILTNKVYRIIGLSHFAIALAASGYYRKKPHENCFSYIKKKNFFTDYFEYFPSPKL